MTPGTEISPPVPPVAASGHLSNEEQILTVEDAAVDEGTGLEVEGALELADAVPWTTAAEDETETDPAALAVGVTGVDVVAGGVDVSGGPVDATCVARVAAEGAGQCPWQTKSVVRLLLDSRNAGDGLA